MYLTYSEEKELKLDLSNLRKYEKTILLACGKTGNMKYDSLLFSFTDLKIYFSNNSVFGNVDFEVELDPEEIEADIHGTEVYENFYVDLHKFLYVLGKTSELNLKFKPKGKIVVPVFYSSGTDEYIIEHKLSNDTLKDLKEGLKDRFQESKSMLLSLDLVQLIGESYKFTEAENEEYNSVVFSENKLYCTTPLKFYQSDVKETFEEEFKIHKDLAKILSSLKDECTLKYTSNDSGESILLEKDGEFNFSYVHQKLNVTIPSEEDIAQLADFSNLILIDKSEFADNLKFFGPLYSSDSKPIKITVLSGSEIELSTVSSYDFIKRVITIKSVSDNLIGFWSEYNASIFENALPIFDTDLVRLYIHPDKIACTVTSDVDTPDKFVSVIEYQKDEA